MKRVTIGQLMLDAANGKDKYSTVPAEKVREVSRGVAQRAQPKIDEIREGQRRVLEEGKPIVLR